MGIFDKLGRLIEDAFLLPDDLRLALERGQQHLDRGEFAEAAREIGPVLAQRPDHPRVGALYARALRGQGDLNGALRAVRRASLADPGDPEVLFELGQAHLQAGDNASAIECFKAAAATLAGAGGPAFARVCAALAGAQLDGGRPDRAVRELRKAVAAVPDDPEAHVRLGEALLADGEPAAALQSLRRAATLEPAPPILARLGAAFLDASAPADAEAALRIACLAASPPPRARLDLARALLADGEWEEAALEARTARDGRPDDPEPRRVEAEAHARAGQDLAALEAFEAALALDPSDLVALRGAVRVAGRVNPARCEAIAIRLHERLAHDRIALAALARAALHRRDATGAAALVARALGDAAGDEVPPELREVAAEVALAQGDGEAALEALAGLAADPPRWASPDLRDRAALLLATAGEPPELSVLCERIHRHARTRPALSGLALEVSRVMGELDRPLQLAVMGEFNAGKSTFINALIGEEVAPMGVTPTTATLNVLRYGAERKVRVVHLDDTVREGAYADLRGILAEAAAASRTVRRVEILFPSETLLAVNLVDTPGTNSLEPEHEKVARRAIEEADAVVWLFRAGQAGKESERRALETIRGHRRKTLGILNRIDRVTAQEVPRLVAHLDAELGGTFLEAVGALSARDALQAKRTGDGALLSSSGIASLEALLEERFYRHALTLKRQSSALRLHEALLALVAAQGLELARHETEARRLEALAPDREALSRVLRDLVTEHVETVRRALASLAGQASVEVDDFVRPRAGLLARRGFAEEDRRFLAELFDERLETLARASSRELGLALGAPLDGFAALLGTTDLARRLEAVAEVVATAALTGFVSYQRGILAGGALDRLFAQTLRPDVAREEFAQALQGLLVDPTQHLAPPLERGVERLIAVVAESHAEALREAHARARAFRARTVNPVLGFTRVAALLTEEDGRNHAVAQ